MSKLLKTLLGILFLASTSQAAYLLEVDTDGMDDGNLAFNPGFTFGDDTTTASQSAASTAFGMTGGDSVFGGNGSAFPDTYVFTYTPGTYAVFATWPFTANVSGGDTSYTILTDGAAEATLLVDQNGGGAGLGHVWMKIGEIDYM